MRNLVHNKEIKSSIFRNLSNVVIKNKANFTTENFSKDINLSESKYRSYPSTINLCNLLDVHSVDIETINFTRNFIKTIEQENSVKCNIFAYYPPGGIIDWHTNENIPHWNAICTFSANGDSFFEYLKNKQPVRVYDTKGWSVKLIKWTNAEPLVWHRAVSKTDRITVTFSSPNKTDVELFIRKIT